jgi:hypothetical protein
MARVPVLLSAAFLAAVAILFAPAAEAQDVDLELVLAVDVSPSMDAEEQILQREGYVAAFRHPEVINAIQLGGYGRIAVTYIEWAGVYQRVIMPWRVIGSEADARAFADDLELQPMSQYGRTSISGGLLFAAGQFEESPAIGLRRAIDISGDGANNLGFPVAPTRDAVVARGITINGLPIILRPSRLGSLGFVDLGAYYEDCVIGGPGAFMITVEDATQFETAIRRKLVLEIAGLEPSIVPVQLLSPAPRVDCLIGEKARLMNIQ